LFEIASGEIAIEEVSIREGKGSTLTCIRFQGFVEPMLDLLIREIAKSDLPICKEREIPREFVVGAGFLIGN
jgi:hypothetical protein